LLPPRDWSLDRTSPLSNRLTGNDNYSKRRHVEVSTQAKKEEPAETGPAAHG